MHVVLEGDATPPPGDAVQVVLGTGETAAGGWGDGAHPSTALCLGQCMDQIVRRASTD